MSQTRGLPGDDQVDLAVEVFRMLADGTRVKLLWLLLDAEQSVGSLAEGVGKPQAAVSQHLAKLRLAHLVQTRRQGNQIFYRMVNDHVQQLVIDALNHVEHAGPGIPSHHRGRTGGNVRSLPSSQPRNGHGATGASSLD